MQICIWEVPRNFLLDWISMSLSPSPDWRDPFWRVMRPLVGFSTTSPSQPGWAGRGHMGAGDTYDLLVALAWESLLFTQSSSSRTARNSSSRSQRNWGFARNWPTTPNKRTNPRGVHTAEHKNNGYRYESNHQQYNMITVIKGAMYITIAIRHSPMLHILNGSAAGASF
jgi:hypothetical protein